MLPAGIYEACVVRSEHSSAVYEGCVVKGMAKGGTQMTVCQTDVVLIRLALKEANAQPVAHGVLVWLATLAVCVRRRCNLGMWH